MTFDNNVAELYNKTAEEYAQNRLGKEDKQELDTFGRLLQPNDKVLDVGCAAGRDSHILSTEGFRTVGTDVAERLLEIARVTYSDVEFVKADMRELPFPDEQFDGIWASAVLHHVNKGEVEKVLKEFNRVLAGSGKLYIKTKAGTGVLSTQENIVGQESRDFTLLTTEELDRLLVGCGFNKIQLSVQSSKSRPDLEWIVAFYQKIT